MLTPPRSLRMLPPKLVQLVQSLIALLLQILIRLFGENVILSYGLVGAAHNVGPVAFDRVVLFVVCGSHIVVDGYWYGRQLGRVVALIAYVGVGHRLCK